MTAVENRALSVTSSAFLSVLEVFDAQSLVNLQCGRMVELEIEFQIPAGEYDDYGVQQCKEVMKIISQMQHIKESGMDFDPRLANRFMRCLKEAVLAGVWKGLCPEWFVDDKNRP
ncbi:Hypothetical predicted protein, partial [Paramuricea clavata]